LKIRINKQAQAEQDLIDIWLYTFKEWDEQQADHYLDLLDEGIAKLLDNQKLGMDCSHVRKGYRRLTLVHHKVYYYLTDHSIEIVRVLHERMDEDRNL
jgi:toxin ParE1/3/4